MLTVLSLDLGAFGDAHESETLATPSGAGAVEPAAIIRDRDFDVIAGTLESNVRAAGAGVRDDVAQRLLCDSIHAERGVLADRRQVSLGAASHGYAVRALELTAVRRQAFDQAEMLEHGRVQIV